MTVLELNEEILKQQKRLQSLENEIEKKKHLNIKT